MLCKNCGESEVVIGTNLCVSCSKEAIMGALGAMEDKLPRFNFEIRAVSKETIKKEGKFKIRASNVLPIGVDETNVYFVVNNPEKNVVVR